MSINFNEALEEFAHFLSTIEEWDTAIFKDELYRKVDHLEEMIQKSNNKSELQDQFYRVCERFGIGPMHHRAREKPLGYAGDYLIIDWIYTNRSASNGQAKAFDQLFQNYEAAEAVRNRKQYFINKCLELSHQKNARIDILDLGCGPCRDVLETYLASDNGNNLHFHCIDNESQAIEYAKKLLTHSKVQDNIRLEHANVLRFKTKEKYDLVWVAGLFDYLDDKLAVLLLKKIWRLLKEEGQIIFGNFSKRNPTRKGMDLVVRWNLIHRSAHDLIQLCRDAGLPFSEIEVDTEPLGVNLFCIIKK